MNDRLFARTLLLAIVLAGVFWLGARLVQTTLLIREHPRPVEARGSLAGFEQTAINVFKASAPSVVYIYTEKQGYTPYGQLATEQGAGSGVIWDRDGHIITNDHVVDGANRVYVKFDDGSRVRARIVGLSRDNDLAVIKVDRPASTLKPLPVGSSHNLLIGQATYAIGNPFGLTRTLTTGVVSALDRVLPSQQARRQITGVIQTDAAINPGNSGGPLLDSAGRMIGINSAILSKTGSFAGIGFAIPVDTVNKIVPQIIAHGRPAAPGIGISVASEELAAQLGIDGVIIAQVDPGGPAAKAGLQGIDVANSRLGDVIIAANGKQISTVSQLAAALEATGIGHDITLTVDRNGNVRTVKVPVVDIG